MTAFQYSTFFLLASLLGPAAAGGGDLSFTPGNVRPECTISVKDGKSTITPCLSWGGSVGAVKVGADVDLISEAKSVVAELTSDLTPDWSALTRVEYSEGKYDYSDKKGVYLTVEANNAERDTFAWFSNAWNPSEERMLKIGGKKIFGLGDGAKVMVEPRYQFETNTPDLCLGYEKADTRAYLTVSEEDQNVKLIQKIGDDTEADVKFGRSAGFLAASVKNQGGLFGTTKVTVTPDDMTVEVDQQGWKASLAFDQPIGKKEPSIAFSKKFSVY